MERIPVHIVTGAPGSGKTALISRLCRERQDWFGLANALPGNAGAGLRLLSSGCPCCTGRVVLQISLARGLRETRATRAFVEIPGHGHAETLGKLLGEQPFSLSVYCSRSIVLPGDAGLQVTDLVA